MAKNWLGSEVGLVYKTVTIPSDFATYVTENGRKVVKSGTLVNDATLGYGLLVNDADITDGERVGSLIIQGTYINNNLPNALTGEQKTLLAGQGLYDIKYETDLNLKVVPVAPSVDLLGKLASQLQTNLAVDARGITGTSKYVTGYTGFSSNVAEQSGNYFAVKATADTGATITAQVIGGIKPPVTLDGDGMIVIRMTSGAKAMKFVATVDDKIMTVMYPINLTLESQS